MSQSASNPKMLALRKMAIKLRKAALFEMYSGAK
jgi:hypothetical protein